MDRGALRATVHGVAKSRTQLSNFHYLLFFQPLFCCVLTHILVSPFGGLLFWYPVAAKDFVRCALTLHIQNTWNSQVALVLKNLHASAGNVRDMVQSLGREAPLEEGTSTHSGILVWRIPWTDDP